MPEASGRVFSGWIIAAALTATVPMSAIAAPAFSVRTDAAGRFWFERASDGARFLSLGVNAVTPEQHLPRAGTHYYNPLERQFKGDIGRWAAASSEILLGSRFNTVACWSSPSVVHPELVHTPILYVAEHEADRCLAGLRSGFEELVERRTREVMSSYAGRSDVLGVFLDNEMPWWGRTAWDVLPTYTVLERAIELPASDEARVAAIEFLRSRHGSIEALSRAYGARAEDWGSLDVSFLRTCATEAAMADRAAFTQLAADRFFDGSTATVRRLHPGVLILGTRFAGDAPEGVISAAGRTCDVISFNSYGATTKSTRDLLGRYWLLGGKPVMVTEFSWRAAENQSGNPNSRGAGGVLKTQQDRAEKFVGFVTDLAPEPMLLGYHWFQFADQSPQGRFDGEDSNYGIVDVDHGRYEVLLSAMREMNVRAAELHASSTRPFPTTLQPRHGVSYTPGQHPGRPPRLSLIHSEPAGPPELWHAVDAAIELSRKSEGFELAYRTGREYGVGVNFRGPSTSAVGRGPSASTDLDGYEFLVLDAEIPAGTEVQLLVNEAGAGQPWKEFDTSAGDDAESFSSIPLTAREERALYRVRIADLAGQSTWGNQSGLRRIDMNAVGSVAVQLLGPGLTGRAHLFDLYLER